MRSSTVNTSPRCSSSAWPSASSILNERGRVEQVKGIVAAQMGASPADAYAVLEFHARVHKISVVAAANDVIEGEVTP